MKRPLSITVTGWLFVVTGGVGIVAASLGLADPASRNTPVPDVHHLTDFALAAGSGLLAAVGGIFVLRGLDWARWVLVVWMAAHIVLSLLHSTVQLIAHVAIFAPLLYLLFHPRASGFFRGMAS